MSIIAKENNDNHKQTVVIHFFMTLGTVYIIVNLIFVFKIQKY